MALTEKNPLKLHTIAIDKKFLDKYMVKEVPRLAAGDMIFVALAKVDGFELITEDKMYREE